MENILIIENIPIFIIACVCGYIIWENWHYQQKIVKLQNHIKVLEELVDEKEINLYFNDKLIKDIKINGTITATNFIIDYKEDENE